MTHQEKSDANALIAEFMGGKVGVSLACHPYPKGLPDWAYEMYDFDKMRVGAYDYDCSWDWIMPVIDKISRIEYDRKFDEQEQRDVIWTHYPVTFGMLNGETSRPMFRFSCSGLFEADTLIEAAYLAVIDFIKWYNEKTIQ